ncbi:MAG: sigma-54-dependent Fis family transcriptional regulator [Spirochaetae bacterium HGW-Spirochaetae-3]|jgi:two-component system response regulator AtoC|nr:MAG: sigma-54-dependent Fis family transcriptional regulator [Spirochaetae bacterium HGW-Spirochaetae-3]
MRILIVDDERNIRESLQVILSLEGIASTCASDGREALDAFRDESFDAVVTDLRMPGMGGQELIERLRDEGLRCPVVMISALGEIGDAVRALKSGAADYLIKPFDPDELVLKLKAAVSSRRLADRLEAGARTAATDSGFIGEGEAARALRRDIEKIAGSDTTVLITGESGSGKEVVAREIHARSPRTDEPFVAVNVGGIHENLIESELFGHEKGAFTGAEARKVGLFELAGAGSLFLDEIGEMPPHLQVKLLRVLQERKIRRLGGTRDIPVSARILSATNRDIEALVRDGRFREDLYYRLNVFRVAVPPLRDRADDVPLLAGFLLAKLRARMGKADATFADGALEALSAYSFPGNVRELENVLERALIYADGDEIRASDLCLLAPSPSADPRPAAAADGSASLDLMERDAIERALAKWSGNRTKAALELGISRRTILYRIKRYGLG